MITSLETVNLVVFQIQLCRNRTKKDFFVLDQKMMVNCLLAGEHLWFTKIRIKSCI